MRQNKRDVGEKKQWGNNNGSNKSNPIKNLPMCNNGINT